MQTPDWKLLNVLFELLTADQLQNKEDESSIFEDICDILQMALVRPYDGPVYLKEDKDFQSGMSNVRDFIITNFIPQLVNKTLEAEMTPRRSLRLMMLADQATKIETHYKNWKQVKIDHLARI